MEPQNTKIELLAISKFIIFISFEMASFLRYSSPARLGTIIDRAMEQTHTVQIITAMGSARVHTYDVSHVADSLTR